MVFTGTIGASVLVDRAVEARGGTEAATRRLVRRVIWEADQYAYKARAESVYVQRGKDHPDTNQFQLDAVWSPRFAVLHGGEYDGDRIEVRQPDQRWPLDVITMPSYRREGIEPIEDVWVYTLVR